MSIESELRIKETEPQTGSAIENELAAYRAISPRAIFALILGALSILSFASPYFLIFAVAALIVGYTADRNIQRFPDILTGRRMAQAGVGLGLIFGLTSLTISTVEGVLRSSQASSFARNYADVLKNQGFDEVVWYGQNPSRRAKISAQELVKEMKSSDKNAMMFDQSHESLRKVKDLLSEPGSEIHFEKLESHGIDGLGIYAGALFEIHTPKAEKAEERNRFALAFMKAMSMPSGRYEWWVEELKFPYKPSSFVAPETKPPDDGHGHSH